MAAEDRQIAGAGSSPQNLPETRAGDAAPTPAAGSGEVPMQSSQPPDPPHAPTLFDPPASVPPADASAAASEGASETVTPAEAGGEVAVAGLVEPKPRRRRGPLLDAGWMFLAAGIALIAATVLIPAVNDLDEAKFYKDRIEQVEKHRAQRLERYGAYLQALEMGDEDLIKSLAAVQLNKAPEGKQLLEPSGQITVRSASPFPALEPPPLHLPDKPPPKNRTALERWTMDDKSRLWLLAGGIMCVLIGLIPPVRRRVSTVHPAASTTTIAG